MLGGALVLFRQHLLKLPHVFLLVGSVAIDAIRTNKELVAALITSNGAPVFVVGSIHVCAVRLLSQSD